MKVADVALGIHTGIVAVSVVENVGVKLQVGANHLPMRKIARSIDAPFVVGIRNPSPGERYPPQMGPRGLRRGRH